MQQQANQQQRDILKTPAHAASVSISTAGIRLETAANLPKKMQERLLLDAAGAPLRPALYACIEGSQQGLFFLSSGEESMAVLHGDGLCYLCGVPSVAFLEELKGMLQYCAVQNLATRRVFVPCTASWHSMLHAHPLALRETLRLSFDPPAPQHAAVSTNIVVLDEAIMNFNADMPLIRQQIASWATAKNFLAHGKAFCRINEECPAHALSIASSFAIGGGEAEISIATRVECRGRGYAKEACRALCEWCFSSSLTPVWSCAKDNAASQALAKSLGFKPAGQYSVFILQ